jgi:hypothetical protein
MTVTIHEIHRFYTVNPKLFVCYCMSQLVCFVGHCNTADHSLYIHFYVWWSCLYGFLFMINARIKGNSHSFFSASKSHIIPPTVQSFYKFTKLHYIPLPYLANPARKWRQNS